MVEEEIFQVDNDPKHPANKQINVKVPYAVSDVDPVEHIWREKK